MVDLSALAAPRSYELLAPMLPMPPGRLLEVGCGKGALAAELSGRGWDVLGLDPDEEACAAARQRGVQVRTGTLADLPEAGDYDVVLFTRSLHHVEDLPGTLRLAHRQLRPGGRLILEEFGRERVDAAAAAFVYDSVDLLLAAGVAEEPTEQHHHHDQPHHDQPHHDAPPPTDPLQRWDYERGAGSPHPLHTGAEMLAEVGRYGPVHETTCETLWRLPLVRVTDAAAGPAIAEVLLRAELRRIEDGTLPAAGFIASVTV